MTHQRNMYAVYNIGCPLGEIEKACFSWEGHDRDDDWDDDWENNWDDWEDLDLDGGGYLCVRVFLAEFPHHTTAATLTFGWSCQVQDTTGRGGKTWWW